MLPGNTAGRARSRGVAAAQLVVVLLALAAVAAVLVVALSRRKGNEGPPAANPPATPPAPPAAGPVEPPARAPDAPPPPAGRPAPDLTPSGTNVPGEAEFRNKDYATAAARLGAHVKEHPGDAVALYMLGRSRLEQGQAEEGEADLEKAWQADAQGQWGRAAALFLGDSLYARGFGQGRLSELWERNRAAYTAALALVTEPAARRVVTDKLDALNKKLLFSAMKTSDSVYHDVQAGEVIDRIAPQYKLPLDCSGSICRINGVTDPAKLRMGQRLKIIAPLKMELQVSKRRLRLTAFLNGGYFGEYDVGIGKEDSDTPAGEYVIREGGKQKNPNWTCTRPDGRREIIPFGDPRNILGRRWMGFADQPGSPPGLGIHGTTDDKSVPGRVSAGCVRMHNPDVELLYDFTPCGTKVTISAD